MRRETMTVSRMLSMFFETHRRPNSLQRRRSSGNWQTRRISSHVSQDARRYADCAATLKFQTFRLHGKLSFAHAIAFSRMPGGRWLSHEGSRPGTLRNIRLRVA
jgi:hypothetical protein